MTQPASIAEAPAPQVRYVSRLTPEVYERFEKSLPAALIDRQASDAGCDASFKLGIQYVLQQLRKDLVSG